MRSPRKPVHTFMHTLATIEKWWFVEFTNLNGKIGWISMFRCVQMNENQAIDRIDDEIFQMTRQQKVKFRSKVNQLFRSTSNFFIAFGPHSTNCSCFVRCDAIRMTALILFTYSALSKCETRRKHHNYIRILCTNHSHHTGKNKKYCNWIGRRQSSKMSNERRTVAKSSIVYGRAFGKRTKVETKWINNTRNAISNGTTSAKATEKGERERLI